MDKEFSLNMVYYRRIKVLKNEFEAQKIGLEKIELGCVRLKLKSNSEINKLLTY